MEQRWMYFTNPAQCFFHNVKTAAADLNARHIVSFAGNEFDDLMALLYQVGVPERKNPAAFVLGYYVQTGNTISKQRIAAVISKLDQLDVHIIPQDIVRYARLFIFLKSRTV